MKSEWKWFIPVVTVVVVGGALLGARNAATRPSETVSRYSAPEISVASQRIVLPWEVAQLDPRIREKLGSFESPKKRRYKRKKAAEPVNPGPVDEEMGMMRADDPELAKAEHYAPHEDQKPAHYEPEWKDWAPG